MYVYRIYLTEGYYQALRVVLHSVNDNGGLDTGSVIGTFTSGDYDVANEYGAFVIEEIKKGENPSKFKKNPRKMTHEERKDKKNGKA